MLRNAELVSDINCTTVAPGQCAFWWLGQLSFVVKLQDTIIYLDPFLTDLKGRMSPPLLRPDELAHASIIVGSHDHADHIDRDSLPAISEATTAPIVVPALLLDQLANDLHIHPSRFVGLDAGSSVTLDGVTITGIAAAHEFLDTDEKTGQHPYLGFVIAANGFTLFFSGDTCKYEGLESTLVDHTPDLVFLPINGRDAARLACGCIGNMTYQEAADLAGALKPTLTVPGHFDMFEGNTIDPQLFVDYMRIKYPQLATTIPTYGKRVVVAAIGTC